MDTVDTVDTVVFLMFDMAQYTVLKMAEYMAFGMIISLELATALDVDEVVSLELTVVTTYSEDDDLQQVHGWMDGTR